jgi:hypothetical protein
MAASCTKDKRPEQPVLSRGLLKNLSEASAASSEVGKVGIPSDTATVSCDVNNQTLTLRKSLYWHTCQACSGEYVEERSDEKLTQSRYSKLGSAIYYKLRFCFF